MTCTVLVIFFDNTKWQRLIHLILLLLAKLYIPSEINKKNREENLLIFYIPDRARNRVIPGVGLILLEMLDVTIR